MRDATADPDGVPPGCRAAAPFIGLQKQAGA